jgi:hypothetical protein
MQRYVPIEANRSDVYFENNPTYDPTEEFNPNGYINQEQVAETVNLYNERYQHDEIDFEDYISDVSMDSIETINEFYNSNEESNQDNLSTGEEVYVSPEVSSAEDSDGQHNNMNEEEFQTIFENLDKIHPALTCTTSDALVMILSFYLKHNLTWVALEHLLMLVNSIFGSKVLPESKYAFRKIFPSDIKPLYHFYCNFCSLLLEGETCSTCEIDANSTSKPKSFASLPIASQILSVLERNMEHIKPSAVDEESHICDVIDGELHKNLILTHINQSEFKLITLTVSTDGATVFKSTKKGSLWPIQMVINELSEDVRFLPENIIVTGFWFGGEPPMQMFFKPFVEELNRINQTPLDFNFNGEVNKIQILPIIITADTKAKDPLQEKIGYNGNMGCSYCLHPGKNLHDQDIAAEIPRRQRNLGLRNNFLPSRVHNLVRYTILDNVELRTHSNTIQDMQSAYENDSLVNGLKGFSPMAGIPHFNVVQGFAIDYMHCALLGVMKFLLSLWFDSTYHRQPFYIGRSIKLVDKSLLGIQPPQNISRRPRSLSDRAFWKANEYRNFLLFYGFFCLRNILPSRYLKHFALLSSSIYLLLKDKITQSDLENAKRSLLQFVSRFQQLYGAMNMRYNVHLLIHIPDCILNCGPLWAYSLFHFEDNIGILVSYVQGNNEGNKQVISKYLLSQTLVQALKRFERSATLSNYLKKTSSKRSVKHFEKNELVCVLGASKPYLLSQAETEICEFLNLNSSEIFIFQRFVYKKYVFHSSEYSHNLASNDSVVKLLDGTIGCIKLIFRSNELFYVILNIKFGENILMDFTNRMCGHLKTMQPIENYLKVVPVTQIMAKCIVIQNEPELIFSILPNQFERD